MKWIARIFLFSIVSSCCQVLAQGVVPTGATDTRVYTSPQGEIIYLAAPNHAGISINIFDRFDVSDIVKMINTADATGQLAGNPNMANGAATLIINQVVGAHPSQLNGILEVVGSKADVVVANPWGITCNGCGFVNIPSVTLTTGVPQIEDGRLTGYEVKDGVVTVTGNGLNTKEGGFLNIFARALEVNAKLHASVLLRAVLGSNRIVRAAPDGSKTSAGYMPEQEATYKITPIHTDDLPEGEAKSAFDVGSMGGMYAKKIFLIGTAAGLGVNNGVLEAGEWIKLQHAGSVALNGKVQANEVQIEGVGSAPLPSLVNKGEIKATTRFKVNAKEMTNTETGKIRTNHLQLGKTALRDNGELIQRESTLLQNNLVDSDNPLALQGETVGLAAEKRAQDEAARLAADRKAQEEAARLAKEEADRKAQEEVARLAKEEADRKAQEEAARLAKEEADRKAQEEVARLAKEEADRKVQEEAARLAKEEADRKAKEEAARLAKEEADRKAQEEAARLAKEEADRKVQEEAARLAKEEADRKAQEEAARLAKEEADRKAQEEAARLAKEEADRKAQEEAARLAKEEADRKAQEQARLAADRQAKEEAARQAEAKRIRDNARIGGLQKFKKERGREAPPEVIWHAEQDMEKTSTDWLLARQYHPTNPESWLRLLNFWAQRIGPMRYSP